MLHPFADFSLGLLRFRAAIADIKNPKKTTISSNAGFTLLEMLIALTLFAVAASGLISATTLNIKQTALLENRTFAAIIAQNRLTSIRVDHTWLPAGNTTDTVSTAGKDWDVKTTVSMTAREDMEKIEISVSQHAAVDSEELVSLTGYLGKL